MTTIDIDIQIELYCINIIIQNVSVQLGWDEKISKNEKSSIFYHHKQTTCKVKRDN